MTRGNIIIILLIVLTLIAGFVILKQKREESQISFEEKQLIEAWIRENNLNQYGNSKDTVYTGGTPLFDKKTGQLYQRQ